MKKYFKLIILIFSISTIFSCDDYLETESKSKFTEEVSFSNLDFATKEIYGIYSMLTSSYLFDYFIYSYKTDTDIELVYYGDNGGNRNISHYSATDATKYLQQVWDIFYYMIERANICIDNLPESPIWEGEYADEAKWLYGEAVTLRAYCYYELIANWGDVPFKIKSTQAGDNFYLPKTDRDSIYEYLVQDLKDVEEFVPWISETMTTERINKAFVKGLRAKMALAYAGYSLRNKTHETRRGRYWEDYYIIANQECKEIMESGEHELNPDFENIFRNLHSYTQDLTYNEVLFEVAFGRLISGRIGYYIGMAFSYNPPDPNYGRSLNGFYFPPNYYYSFDKFDLRRNVTVELYDYTSSTFTQDLISANGRSFTPCKWRKSWLVPALGGTNQYAYYTGINWPLMRYSDIVLMLAESENEINGPTDDAKEALSLVRGRAFDESQRASKVTNYVDSVSVSKEDFFNAIVNERAWEFGGEFTRKYDLVRWNLLGAKINQMKDECTKIFNDDPSYVNYNKVQTYIFWKLNGDGTIDILNPDYRLPSTSITDYTRSTWLPEISETNKNSFFTYLGNVAYGYDAAKNNHLQPISINTITASNGVLNNDQIP